MKIDIRTGQPFTGEPPKKNNIVSLPVEKKEEEKEEKTFSNISVKVREVRNILQKPLKERAQRIDSKANSLVGHINRLAKLLRDEHSG